MLTAIAVSSAIAILSLTDLGHATPIRRSTPDVDFAGYVIFNTPMNWAAANNFCANQGGTLATVHSRAGNNHIYNLAKEAGVRENDGYWLDGVRKTVGNTDANWQWSSISTGPLSFGMNLPNVDNDPRNDLWVKNEPNNYRGKEDCVMAKSNDDAMGRWNDANCNNAKPAVACWIKPTTTTTTEPATTTTTVVTTSTTPDPTTTTTVVTTSTTVVTTTTTAEPTSTTTVVTTSTTEQPTTTTTLVTTSTTEKPTTTTTLVTTSTTEGPSTTTTIVTTTTPIPTTRLEPTQDWQYFPGSDCWYQQFGSNDNKKTQAEAIADCSSYTFHDGPAWLASPMSVDEAMFVGSLGEAGKPAWTSARRLADATDFFYANGDEILSGNWYDNEPNGEERNEMCVQRGLGRRGADTYPYRFNDVPCTATIYWTCQYCHATTSTTPVPTTTTTEVTTTTTEVTTTTTVVTSTTTEQPTTTTTVVTTTTQQPTTLDIPDDWSMFDETGCYYHISDVRSYTFNEAVQYCNTGNSPGYHKEAGMTSFLAWPETEYEAMFMASFHMEDRPTWMGIQRQDRGSWQTIKGGPYMPTELFYPGEGVDNTNSERCVQMGYRRRTSGDTTPWKLNDALCSNTNFAICKWCPPPDPTTTTTERPSTTTTLVTTTTTEVTTTTTEVTTTTTEVTTTTTEVTSTTTTGFDRDQDNLVLVSASPTPSPTPSPSPSPTPSPSPSPTPSPTPTPTPSPSPSPTPEPTPSPTPAPSPLPTPSPTNLPSTTEPSPSPTCGVVPQNLQDDALTAIQEHHKYIGQVIADTPVRKSGRSDPYKTTCDDFCAQRSFGAGCQPCKLETLTSEDECMFPGPFGTGVLCHVDAITMNVTSTKCCMRKNEDLGYAPGNALTTCRLPKRQCDCDSGFDYSQAFAASFFMGPLNRVWTGVQCLSL